MKHLDKEDAFWMGNLVGLLALIVTFIVVRPMKEKERQEFEAKQQATAHAAQIAGQVIILKKALKRGESIEVKELLVKSGNTKVDPHALHTLAAAAGMKAQHELKAGTILLDSDLEVIEDKSKRTDENQKEDGAATNKPDEEPKARSGNQT